MKKLAVVAFGGNALLRGEQKGTIEEQEKNAQHTCEKVYNLIKEDYDLILTHGNGPQVGNILLANSAGDQVHGIPEMPLDVCVAYSQGFIAYVLEQQLHNVLRMHDCDKQIISLVTQVLVDKDDPAFQNPTKPVGPYYTEEAANKMAAETGSVFKADPRGRGYRKVVASPKPLSINNQSIIEKLARRGHIVIACGGGGVPVYFESKTKLRGIDAVIDKDLASALLAANINADEFYILTDVPKVCIHFNTLQQQELGTITIKEAEQYLAEGHFAEGSMAPKVRAAVSFAKITGHDAIITCADALGNPSSGTRITI